MAKPLSPPPLAAEEDRGSAAARRHLLRQQPTPHLSELTLGLLHRFNNLFTGVMFLMEECIARAEAAEPLRDRLGEITGILRQAHACVDRVLRLHTDEEDDASFHEVDALIVRDLDLLQLLLPRGAAVHHDAEPRLHFYGSQRAFRAILLHLFGNAGMVLPRRGAAVWVTAHAAGGSVAIVIRDNGPGFAPEVIERAFEPFFTTREEAGHAGLGLFHAREVARAAGGDLAVANHPAGGAAFTLTLPQEPTE